MGYLATEQDRQVYYEHYAGEAKAIVLIHGWGLTSCCWDTTLPALLDAGHEVVRLDLRACGRSDKDFRDVSIDAMAEDVVKLVEHLGLSQPVLNGWSLGGGVATAAVAKLGNRVSGLVLTAGASPRHTATNGWEHGGTVEDVSGVIAALAANRADTLRGVAEGFFAEAPTDDTLHWIWRMLLETGPRADESLRDLAHMDLRDEFSAIEVPILLLHGNSDGIVPFSAAQAAEALAKNAKLVEFDGVGHTPFLEDRDRYLSELTSFLAA